MPTAINNKFTNCLSFTSMIKAGKVHASCSFDELLNQGWNFFFEVKGGKMYSIMTAEFPHGPERLEVETDEFISDAVLKTNAIAKA